MRAGVGLVLATGALVWCGQPPASAVAETPPALHDATRADQAVSVPDRTSELEQARQAFSWGTRLYEEGQFEQALKAFSKSREHHPSPRTTYALAMSERQLRRGHYARAFHLFLAAMKDTGGPDAAPLDDAYKAQAHYELVRLAEEHLVSVPVRIPAGADVSQVLINGVPLTPVEVDGVWGSRRHHLVGGADRGPAQPPPAREFTLATEPGELVVVLVDSQGQTMRHVIKIGRGGIPLELDPTTWPIKLRVLAVPPGARVRLRGPVTDEFRNGPVVRKVVEFNGLTPGMYEVEMTAPEYKPARGEYHLSWGTDDAVLLPIERTSSSITDHWWFWTAAVAITAGAAAYGTWQLTREPAADGGELNWAPRAR